MNFSFLENFSFLQTILKLFTNKLSNSLFYPFHSYTSVLLIDSDRTNMDKEGRSHRRHSSHERSVSRSYSRRSPSSHSYSRSDRRSSDRSRRRESSSDRRSHRHSSHNDRDRSSSRYRDRRRDESRRRERDVSQSRSRRREERSESVEPNQGKITINKTFKGFKLQKPVMTGGLKVCSFLCCLICRDPVCSM